jgi:hypothetical protein
LSSSPDVKSITERFFSAYDAHDVDDMPALCADGAQGRYLPYGKNGVMPVRGGIEKIRRGFPKAVPDLGVEIIELIPGEEDAIVVQALLGGTMPADVAGLVKKGEPGRIAHAYIIRYNRDGKIWRLDCYWGSTAINT